MKKKILVLLVVIILIAGACLAYAAMNLNSLIEKFRPDLEKIASQTLGMPVNIGNLEASVFPETKILVKEFKLGGGDKSQAFKLNNLALSVKLSALLFSQKLEITKLSIDSPEVTVTKTSEGMEISGLPKKAPSAPSEKKEPAASSAPASSPIGISLNSLEVNDAKITLKGFMPDKELSLSEIDIATAINLEKDKINISNLKYSSILLNQTKLTASADSITLDNGSGDVKIPLLKVKLNDDPIDINADYNLKTASAASSVKSSGINLDKLIAGLSDFVPPAVRDMSVKGSVKPDFNIKTSGSNFNINGTLGLADISALVSMFKVTGLGGTINIDADNLIQKIKSQDLSLSANGSIIKIILDSALKFPEFNIEKLAVNAFSGTLNTKGGILVGTPITFDLQNQVAGMQVVQIMNTLKPGMDMLVGNIEKANASLKGTLDANFMKNLTGNVFYILTDGELKGFNIGGMALKAANNLAFLSGSLYDKVQGNKELFDVANTVVKKSQGNISIAGGAMHTKDLTLNSTAYDLNAEGKIGFDTSLDLNADIIFTPEVSAKIVGGIKELNNALDQNKRLNMPLSIEGVPPSIVVIPNLQKLIELGAKNLLREKAGQLLSEGIKKKTGIDTGGLDKLLGF